MGHLDAVLADCDQPGGGQPLKDQPGLLGAPDAAQLFQAGSALGVDRALTDSGQPQEDASGDLPLGGAEPGVDILGGLGDRSLDPARGQVVGQGEGAAPMPLPGLQQCVREQGQGACFVPGVVQRGLHQGRLDRQPGVGCRLREHRAKLALGHWADQQLRVLQGGD
jgi:hypothetical protein